MDLAGGALLVATPVIGDGVFARSVVLLLDHDDDGTLGVVLGDPGEAPVAPLLPGPADVAAPAVVFRGGPVQPEVLLALGVDADGGVGWGPLAPGVPLPGGSVRVFAGYAGWAPGQLDGEVSAAAWWVLPALPGDLLPTRPAALWRTVVRRLPAPACFAATLPANPREN